MATAIREKIIEQVDRLSTEDQSAVLQFVTVLTNGPPKRRPESAKKFLGVLSDEDAIAMKRAIEEGCEQIDPSAW